MFDRRFDNIDDEEEDFGKEVEGLTGQLQAAILAHEKNGSAKETLDLFLAIEDRLKPILASRGGLTLASFIDTG